MSCQFISLFKLTYISIFVTIFIAIKTVCYESTSKTNLDLSIV